MSDNEPRKEEAEKPFRTIGEVADVLGLKQHVLRFWEKHFPQIQPIKQGRKRRLYRPADVRVLRHIQALLYDRGYTIRGAQQHIKNHGLDAQPPMEDAPSLAASPAPPPQDAPITTTATDKADLIGKLEDIRLLLRRALDAR